MDNFAEKQISYQEAARIADERTMKALVAIGSPPLELDENGRVSVAGGMTQELMHAYGVAYLGEKTGGMWASLGYPLESADSEVAEKPEAPKTIFNSFELLEKSTKRSANWALFQLSGVIAVVVALWFSGFNVYLTDLFSAYFSTWAISPVAGIVFTVFVYVAYRLIEFLKRLF